MRLTPIITLSIALLCGISNRANGQECNSLANANPADLVSFLARVLPDEKNAECVTWAINQLGTRRYEPATATLVRFLDFHRPLTANERLGFYLRPQGIGDVYPAVDALVLIGLKALPTVLQVIEADSTSPKARLNAVFVWMEIHRHTDEHPKGVALLKQEETKAKDDAAKKRLKWAVSEAITWCNPPEESACKRAAGFRTP